jgi:hypothetical protein
MLTIDSGHNNNNTHSSGWIGETTVGTKSALRFCRIDGRLLRPVRSSNTAHNYAVLKLGSSCPAGSVEFTRYFDNNDACGNSTNPSCNTYADLSFLGDIAPNQYGGNYANNLWMRFCMFRASSSASSFSFPNLGHSYGVFAAAGLIGAMESGYLYTDDEDSANNNSTSGDLTGSAGFLTLGSNTTLRMARVR